MVNMKNLFLLILLILLFSCAKKNLGKMGYYEDNNIISILRDNENDFTLTIGLQKNSIDSAVVKIYQNNSTPKVLYFGGRPFYSKLINNELIFLVKKPLNQTELIRLNYKQNNTTNKIIIQENLNVWDSNYDLILNKNLIEVATIKKDTLSKNQVFKTTNNKIVDTLNVLGNPMGYYLEKESEYLLIEDYPDLIMYKRKNDQSSKFQELFKFESKLSDFNIKIRKDTNTIFIILNSSSGESEIWRYSEIERKIYYFKAFTSVGDIAVLPEGNVITYMNKIDANFSKFYTKLKNIEKWREFPFVFFE